MSYLLRRTIALTLAALIGAASVLPAETPVKTTEDSGSVDLIDEDFEGVFPRLPWRVSHPADAAGVDWGRTRHRASDGRWSIYCAGMGPAAPDPGGPTPTNTSSWAIVGPFDLTDAASGTMSFDLWLETEPYRDVFMWLASVDGQTFSGDARSTDTGGWQRQTVNLADWGGAGSVLGEAEVWVAFVYQSDHSNSFEGAYIDDVQMTVDVGAAVEEGRVYTDDADFAEGEMVGLQISSNKLLLADSWQALPYLWMPNTGTGTVSKLDVDSGIELARYRTGPAIDGNPGVAAVDLEGSCWVGNRFLGTVVKIGLLENGGCTDRDGDGEITTSEDANGDGDITGSEILAWGEDECVLLETVLVEGLESTRVPGEDHSDYEVNNLQAVAVDGAGDVWVGVFESNMIYLLDGSTGEILDEVDLAADNAYPTSAVVDGNGKLWLSSWDDPWVIGFEPVSGETSRIDLPHGSNGLAVDGSGDLLVTGWNHSSFSKIDLESETVEWTLPSAIGSAGVAVTENGRIWVAAAGDGVVTRYNSDGDVPRSAFFTGLAPMGVAVDQDGKIWVAPALSEAIFRLSPAGLVTELSRTLVGSGGHDAVGDFTGIVVRNVTTRYGTWTVVHDSQASGTPWGLVSWNANVPDGTRLRVRVRSSEDQDDWSPWETAGDGVELGATPPGRYLQIQVSLQVFSGDGVPKLKDLTVVPATIVAAPQADFTWAPTSPGAGQTVSFTDTSTGDPTSWTWDFGDGGTSEDQNPDHDFAEAGTYDVSLTVANDAGTDQRIHQLVVSSTGGCELTCSASVPATADIDQPVSFSADADATACTGEVAYTWSFGDGATSTEQTPIHTYSIVGTLRWRLSASVDGVVCSTSGDITVSGAGPEECEQSYWVPVVSRTNGAAGSVWRSDLGLLGADPEGAAVELRFHGTEPQSTRVVTVVPGAMVSLVDVVDWLAPAFRGSGSLEICSDGELVIDSRTYNLLATDHDCFGGGTFGQHLSGRPTGGLATGESSRLGHLRQSAAFRTNIGLVNTGDTTATVRVELFDATGDELTTYEVELDPGMWQQDNRPLAERAGRTDLDAASARVTVLSGDGVVAYASVIDERTNDATTVTMR